MAVALQGKLAESEPLFRDLLAGYRQAHGDGHPKVTVGCQNLGTALAKLERYAEAEPLFVEVLAGLSVRFTHQRPSSVRFMHQRLNEVDSRNAVATL